MPIKLLITGGTLDKDYNALTGELEFSKSRISDMLEQSRSKAVVNIGELMLIDSLDMTNEHRQKILKACQEAEEDEIVVTHGTDTMVETAKVLGQNVTGKTVVLFGAMRPYALGESDALFNLGSAITAAQTLDEGVYIAMNGHVFTWDNVVKNRELGEFQTKA